MKWLHALLALLVGITFLFSYKLWFTPDEGVHEVEMIKEKIAKQKAENNKLKDRNQAIEVNISSLKNDVNAQEEVARYKLGLIQENETFFQILPEEEQQ